jgi:hypothetical protein
MTPARLGGRLLARTGRRLFADDRGDVPMRVGPMLLVALILVVLAIVGARLL